MAGLTDENDVVAELRPARTRRNVFDLKKVMDHIEGSCNPFQVDKESNNKLFNINTGKAASHEICESLLNIPQRGQMRHQDFLYSCMTDANRFIEKITRAKLKTFSDDCARNLKAEDKHIAGTRDLMPCGIGNQKKP